LRERNESRDPAQRLAHRNMVAGCGPSCRPWVPGLAVLARTREGSARSRGARSEPLAVIPDSRCQTAQCCSFPRRVAAPGLSVSSHVPSLSRPPASPRGFDTSGRRDSSNSVPPMRGGWSADRRTHSFGRACDARPPCPGATGTSLGAPPWRFSDADPRSRLPAVEPEPQRLPAPGINARRSGSGPPALRFAPQSRDATPCSVSRIVSGRRPLLSEDANPYIINSLRSQ